MMRSTSESGRPTDSGKTGALSAREVDAARAAAQCVVQTHRRLVEFLRVGQTLAQIDAFVAGTLADLRCRSAFLGYRVGRSPAFPSHACLSANECIVHGTAGYTTAPMKDGDLLKIDIGVVHQGWIGDAAWTYAFKAPPSQQAQRLMDAGKESLRLGIQALAPGRPYMAWARAVQQCAEVTHGFHLVRGLGGHGYGRKLHAPPFVSNVVPRSRAEWPEGDQPAIPGTLIALEPMLAIGTGETRQHPKQWPVFTADGSLSVHYEHDVLITSDGVCTLTEGLDDLPDIVG